MKSKSILRRLEQLEKKVLPPEREIGGLVIFDHQPTEAEIAKVREKYIGATIIIEDKLED